VHGIAELKTLQHPSNKKSAAAFLPDACGSAADFLKRESPALSSTSSQVKGDGK
jgi:hypothetical protein